MIKMNDVSPEITMYIIISAIVRTPLCKSVIKIHLYLTTGDEQSRVFVFLNFILTVAELLLAIYS
jgi:hypothetical protein